MSTPKFLSDEDLRGSIVSAIRRTEPSMELARAVDVGLAGASDEKVLEYATANGWLVVSHDVSTMTAAAERRIAEGDHVSGLLLVQQSAAARPVVEDLVLIWSASQSEERKDQIVYVPL